jgi:hypothetical protein
LSSFFSFGVLVGAFFTFFLASWLLLMPNIVIDAAIGCAIRLLATVNGGAQGTAEIDLSWPDK